MGTKTIAIGADWAPDRATTAAVPWTLWCCVAAVTSVILGAHWDIAWHRSIGRDDFWTPPHVAIYFCGVLAGLACAWLILSTTFDRSRQANTVRIWGLHAPLGAFIISWGGAAMLTSAPFDDWWHNAYGLDTKILSPPHVLLILGVFGVMMGTMMLILGQMNRAERPTQRKLSLLFLYIGGMILVLLSILVMELTFRVQMHNAGFYRVVAVTMIPVLVGVGQASRQRWGATGAAAVYMLVICAFQWILPLFPASPKLGPVYYPVTHFVPPGFPLLLIVPALAIDLLRARFSAWPHWRLSLLLGTAALAVFIAVQWPFSNFLMTDYAKNWFFGTHYYDYGQGPRSSMRRNVFFLTDKSTADFYTRMAMAFGFATLTAWFGLGWGAWMRRIVR
ncbi:MAG: hypothetical protein K2X03_24955 [Bryobacteraceae bacterium]|nr:hypothetical protein [Bryobacteraceae bacterium]